MDIAVDVSFDPVRSSEGRACRRQGQVVCQIAGNDSKGRRSAHPDRGAAKPISRCPEFECGACWCGQDLVASRRHLQCQRDRHRQSGEHADERHSSHPQPTRDQGRGPCQGQAHNRSQHHDVKASLRKHRPRTGVVGEERIGRQTRRRLSPREQERRPEAQRNQRQQARNAQTPAPLLQFRFRHANASYPRRAFRVSAADRPARRCLTWRRLAYRAANRSSVTLRDSSGCPGAGTNGMTWWSSVS